MLTMESILGKLLTLDQIMQINKYLTNLLRFCLVGTRIFKKFLSKASKTGKQASKASIKSAENGFSLLTNCNLQANVSRKYV